MGDRTAPVKLPAHRDRVIAAAEPPAMLCFAAPAPASPGRVTPL
jgi:hypothetical protein